MKTFSGNNGALHYLSAKISRYLRLWQSQHWKGFIIAKTVVKLLPSKKIMKLFPSNKKELFTSLPKKKSHGYWDKDALFFKLHILPSSSPLMTTSSGGLLHLDSACYAKLLELSVVIFTSIFWSEALYFLIILILQQTFSCPKSSKYDIFIL